MSHSDVLIIGSGPAGYTAAIYAARAGHSVTVLAGMSQPGGALTTTTEVDNFPGFPEGVQGPALMDDMLAQAERFGANVIFEDAEFVNLNTPVKTVATADEQYTADAVIVATGSAYKHLGVPGEHLGGVSYCATCDGFFFAGKNVTVVGGGDSAAEEALYLANVAAHVTLLVRSDKFRASQVMADKVLAHPNITVRWNSAIAEVVGDGAKLTHLILADGSTVETDGLFIAIGHTPRSDLFKGVLATDRDGYVLTSPGGALTNGRVTATTVDGVFAAGDVADRTYRQAITAAASGCKAALDAHHYLQERHDV